MSILIDANTRVAVHGLTAAYANSQLASMLQAGTRVVAGVALGSGGKKHHDIALFDTMAEAVAATGANASLIFVPAQGALDATLESLDAGIKLIVCAAEHVPVHDAVVATAAARQAGAWLVGPNTLGMAVPGQGMLGALAPDFLRPGHVGIISRSGSLTANTLRHVAMAGLGQSACVHIGGDYLCGRNPGEYVELFEQDEQTSVIAYCGEVGGTKEYDIARRMSKISKPVVAMIVGRAAPPEKRLGHAGALVLSDRDTARAKLEALGACGVHLAKDLRELAAKCRALSPRAAASGQVFLGATR